MNFVIPTDELEELGELVDKKKLEPLRDKYEGARRTKQPLERYSSRTWLFPFGVHPSPTRPVEVFRNGLAQWMDHEVKLFRVGLKHPITVVVFLQDTQENDRVQATYIAVPSRTN
jgi:hypothetical protein